MRAFKNLGMLSIVVLLAGGLGVWLRLIPLPPTLSFVGDSSVVTAPPETGRGVTVYLTLSPDCPISCAYIPLLNRMSAQYGSAGVQFLGVVPESAATPEATEVFCDRFRIGFPVVHDRGNRQCRRLGATHTPQAVITTLEGRIVYSGRIDDQYRRVATSRRKAREESLRLAIVNCLQNRIDVTHHTDPVGCLITDVPSLAAQSSDVTFSGHIAEIVFRHCARCHRAGEAAPFALMTFDDVKRHAAQALDVVQRGIMPPWKPVKGHGEFQDEARLLDSEIELLSLWVSNGMPQGDPAATPPAPRFTEGWQLGEPDLELIMPESFPVPADGPDIYQHFVIPTELAENRLIRAVEFRPGSPEVVHHSFMYFDTTGQGRELDAQQPGPGYTRVGTPGFAVSGSLGGWGPGGLPRELPADMGRPLPADADLVVQIHYHPCGRATSDRSRIGLYFADPFADRFVTEILVADIGLVIPPQARAHSHVAEWTLPVDTWLLDATPHMHTLGKRIQAMAYLPDSTVVPLIRIEDWDFYWQDSYVYRRPVALPAGTRIRLECWFDNSDANPLNPASPPVEVRWGDFSNDEMGICYFRVTTRDLNDYVRLNTASTEYFQTMWSKYQKSRSLPDADGAP